MPQHRQQPKVDIGSIAIDTDITLRRMVIHPEESKGTVLLLHGFPETLHAWKDIALALADDYEVHAFDWPGFGLSSRPPADRSSLRNKMPDAAFDRYASPPVQWRLSIPIPLNNGRHAPSV